MLTRATALFILSLACCSSGGRASGDPPPVPQPEVPAPRQVAWRDFPLRCVPESAALLDADGDRRVEVAVLCGGTVYLTSGDGEAGQDKPIWRAPPGAVLLGAAPLDDALRDSLVVAAGDTLRILYSVTSSGCRERVVRETASTWIGADDLDGDGRTDVVLGAPEGRAVVLFGDGSTALVEQSSPAWAITRIEGQLSLVGFSGGNAFSIPVARGKVGTARELPLFDLRPRWATPMGTTAEDGFILSDRGGVVGVVPGDPQLRTFDTCDPRQPPVHLTPTASVIACPAYVAVLGPRALAKIPLDRDAAHLLAGDLDGDGSTDLLVLTGRGALLATDPGSALGS